MSDNQSSNLPQHIQQRNRSIAEREASRLARPERRQTQALGHATRSKSAVSSTPSGFDTFKRRRGIVVDENEQQINDNDNWCGPFSVARQMIAAREEARKKREEERQEEEEKENPNMRHPLDELVQQAELEKKRKANPSMTWKPNKITLEEKDQKIDGNTPNLYHKRQKRLQKQKQNQHSNRTVPSLFQTCVKFIVDNFESVESLGYTVDNTVRRAICESLVANGKMNGAAFDTLAEEGIEILEIVDCTSVTSEQMVEALSILIPAGLRALILKHAGRCFTSKAIESITKAKSNGGSVELFAISIGGAYLMKDADIAKLVAVASPTLSSIELSACPFVGLEFCNALGMYYASNVGTKGSCLLELSLQDIPLSKDNLLTLASASDAFQNLKSITLKSMDALDDEVLHKILSSITNGNLEGIDLSNNVNLTDQALSSIRRSNSNGRLRSLQLSGIKNFTAAGLETFFTFDIPGLPDPPTLRYLNLSECEFDAINKDVVNLAITASAVKRQTNKARDSGKSGSCAVEISTMGGLISLDVSGSSITDENMESLASLCHVSLKELKINFCTNISDKGLGYLVSKVKHQFNRLEIWGCAQITETFLDGHCRVDGGGLDIIGVWMAKGSRGSKQ